MYGNLNPVFLVVGKNSNIGPYLGYLCPMVITFASLLFGGSIIVVSSFPYFCH